MAIPTVLEELVDVLDPFSTFGDCELAMDREYELTQDWDVILKNKLWVLGDGEGSVWRLLRMLLAVRGPGIR